MITERDTNIKTHLFQFVFITAKDAFGILDLGSMDKSPTNVSKFESFHPLYVSDA